MTTIDGIVFPQDPGNADITAQEADYSSAAYFGGHLARSNVDDYKDGVIVSADFTAETIDVGSGLAFITDTRVIDGQDANGDHVVEWDENTSLVVAVEETLGIGFSETVDFDVFVEVNPSVPNGVEVNQHQIGNEPTNPHLKIARVRQESTQEVINTYNQPEAEHSAESVKQTVEDGESLAIESDQSRVVVGGYTVDGELQVDGTLKVI
jgi:hypothetical protein